MTPPCPERAMLLHALADGELDPANTLAMERHLEDCAGCAAELERIVAGRRRAQQPGARYAAPPALGQRVAAALAAEARPARRGAGLLDLVRRWSWAPSLVALAASLVLFLAAPAERALEQELVSSHVHSLLASHLTDVESGDQHTVKPWFAGKLDFAPPVVVFAGGPFTLLGGRVDYLEGRVVAALVYGHQKHVINLFIWPSSAPAAAPATLEGYNLLNWTRAGLTLWAVSDAEPAVLRDFQQAFSAATPE